MTDWIEEEKAKAEARLRAVLDKPWDAPPRDDGIFYQDDNFNPWDLFDCVYGSYSSTFDDCAIDVLTEIRDSKKIRYDLGAEMFREMLCTQDFCEYGSSPRVCFWNLDPALLVRLLDRWTEYRDREWHADEQPNAHRRKDS